jgi:serine/threonine protein phosphatase PrpC
LALLLDGRAYIANVGDSRIYRLRRGRLRQLSQDHSVVAELLDQGRIQPDDVNDHEAQGEITRYVGMEERAHPYVRSFLLKAGDRLLLCTDGLTDLVSDKDIVRIMGGESDCQAACDALVAAANAAGGTDNATAVIVDWLGG